VEDFGKLVINSTNEEDYQNSNNEEFLPDEKVELITNQQNTPPTNKMTVPHNFMGSGPDIIVEADDSQDKFYLT
jgi:hypothetical protein